jgi:hypothetical protein
MEEIRESDHRSVSSGCTFCRCPRLYFWQKHCRLQRSSPGRELAMDFGTAIHAAAPFTHIGPQRDLVKAFGAFAESWGTRDEFGDKKRNTRVGKNIVMDLFAQHGASSYPFRVQEPEVKSFVEKGKEGPHEITFDVDLGLPSGKPLNGRIDALAKRGDDLWVMEYKTTSQLWSSFGELWGISPQLESYALALSTAGYEIKGGVVEGILVASGKTEVCIVPIGMEEAQLSACQAWWERLDARMAACEKAPEDPAAWPMSRESCSPYPCYGLQGFVCEFQPLCLAGERWPGLVGMYEQAPLVEKEGETA